MYANVSETHMQKAVPYHVPSKTKRVNTLNTISQ